MEDSTIAVKELKRNSEGYDYCPFLLRRTKIRKNSQRMTNNLISNDDIEPQTDDDSIKPIDLEIGKVLSVLGNRFLLCDCDARTRVYYENILKTPQGDKVVIEKVKTARTKVVSEFRLDAMCNKFNFRKIHARNCHHIWDLEHQKIQWLR